MSINFGQLIVRSSKPENFSIRKVIALDPQSNNQSKIDEIHTLDHDVLLLQDPDRPETADVFLTHWEESKTWIDTYMNGTTHQRQELQAKPSIYYGFLSLSGLDESVQEKLSKCLDAMIGNLR